MFSKNALQLLSIYENDSSDDELVPGCKVSTKRTRKDIDEDDLQRNKILKLPLPNIITNHVENNELHSDNPNSHQGRLRSFPHERGNWATYVYIPYEVDDIMAAFITNIIEKTNVDMKPMEDLHVSLTRTVILKHHWINSFIESVRTRLSAIKRFAIIFNSLKVYCNEERTRTFLGLHIQVGYDSLIQIVKYLDVCLGEFNLPIFYDNPSFHMSIAWCVGDFEEQLNNILSELNGELEKFINDYIQTVWYNYVQNVNCKCGNKLFKFELI